MSEPPEPGATRKASIRDWWASFPQTYGRVHGQTVYGEADASDPLTMGSRDFFDRLDQTFYGWNGELHTEGVPFGKIFPYDRYRHRKVLEIGCGLGTMAMNWAKHGAHVTAVDLNPVSVEQTTRRFDVHGLDGRVLQMDAHALSFLDEAFDYVYSFGVLHHSPDLPRSIKELFRVLRGGGGFGIMLYNRASVRFRFLIRYLEGYLHGESGFLDPVQLASRYTDGAREEGNPHTWPVTPREIRDIVFPYSADVEVEAFGSAEYAFPPKIESYLPAVLTNAWARRWGWSLWTSGTKRR